MLQYDIEEGQYYDLILSDIEMPQIDGMDLAAYMKRYLPDVLIIFITSHLKYAVDAFELSVSIYTQKYDWRKTTQSIDRRGENDRTTGR